MTVELGNTVPNSGQSSVLTDVRATSQETAPASGVSTINQSAITAAVQSGHPVSGQQMNLFIAVALLCLITKVVTTLYITCSQ